MCIHINRAEHSMIKRLYCYSALQFGSGMGGGGGGGGFGGGAGGGGGVGLGAGRGGGAMAANRALSDDFGSVLAPQVCVFLFSCVCV